MNIVICDDQETALQDIYKHVQDCLNDCPKTNDDKVYTFTSPQELIDSLDDRIYDIAYLDIELNDINGIDLAHILKEINPHCMIHFITNYEQYVHDAFVLDAVQYLRKPIDKQLFKEEFNRMLQLYHQRNFKMIFHTNKGNTILKTKEIIYVETYYRQIKIVTIKDTYYTNIKQKEAIHKILKTLNFLKVQRSFMVNMNYIQNFTKKTVILKNNEELPISSIKRENIISQFNQFLMNTISI